jgi:hypothetical protein
VILPDDEFDEVYKQTFMWLNKFGPRWRN